MVSSNVLLRICIVYYNYAYTPHPVLNKYIDSLDQRLAVVTAKDLPGNVAKKIRKTGEPSTSAPPLDAPAWAVKKPSDSNEGMFVPYFCVTIFYTSHSCRTYKRCYYCSCKCRCLTQWYIAISIIIVYVGHNVHHSIVLFILGLI